MNSAKKIMKNQKDDKKSKSSGKFSKAKLLLFGGIAVCVLLVAALCYEQFRPRVIVTVGDEKVYLTDAMYDIYSTEAQYNSMNDLYKQIYGTDYWNMEVDDEGTKGATAAKNAIMDTLQQRSVLCQEAKKNGVFLTEDEKKKTAEQVSKIRGNMTDKQKKMVGLSESALTDVLEKQALADKYKKQLIAGYDIDDAAIAKTVDKKENRQYNLQYYYASTMTTGENNTQVAKSDEEKAALKQAMEAHYEQAKTAKDFTKLLGEDEKSGVEYRTRDLVEKDEDFLTAELRAKLKKMKNGEISELIEAEDGYYFFRMDNNNSTAAYDQAVKDAVTAKENEAFATDYQIIAIDYKMTINKSQWKKIKLGTYTIK